MPDTGWNALEALRAARAFLARARQALHESPLVDPGDVRAVCAEAAAVEEDAQRCVAAAVAGRGGQLTVTIVDPQGRVRVYGG